MVPVYGGTFAMGQAEVAVMASPPQPSTTVQNFALDAFEVTVARFRRWVAAGRPVPNGPVVYRGGTLPFEGTVNTDTELNCDDTKANYPRRDRENHPINCVNWATAQAFCVWDGGRLPTQVEWEFAARGSSESPRNYPWGSAAPDDALTCWSGSELVRETTCPVGMFRPGAVNGIHDLAGNVYEWNADWYATYRLSGTGCWSASGTRNALCVDRTLGSRVVRGGGFRAPAERPAFLAASRYPSMPSGYFDDLGFRCARDIP